MTAWILLWLLLAGIALILFLLRPRDDFLRSGRPPRRGERTRKPTLLKR